MRRVNHKETDGRDKHRQTILQPKAASVPFCHKNKHGKGN